MQEDESTSQEGVVCGEGGRRAGKLKSIRHAGVSSQRGRENDIKGVLELEQVKEAFYKRLAGEEYFYFSKERARKKQELISIVEHIKWGWAHNEPIATACESDSS